MDKGVAMGDLTLQSDETMLAKLPRLVAVYGDRDSGRSLVAKRLIQEYGYIEFRMQDAVIDLSMAMFPMEREMYTDKHLKTIPDEKYNESPLAIMSAVGQMMRDMVHEYLPDLSVPKHGYWLSFFLRWYRAHRHQRVVITGMHYENEARLVRHMQGLVWCVSRPTNSTLGMKHHVETDGIGYSTIIFNTGTVENLHYQVDVGLGVVEDEDPRAGVSGSGSTPGTPGRTMELVGRESSTSPSPTPMLGGSGGGSPRMSARHVRDMIVGKLR
jgi:hypothetical protein